MQDANQQVNLRHNLTVNVLDGAFFGFGIGLASYVTVLPLFIASLTDSTILIGLVGALHLVGWQLPQILTSGVVSRRAHYLPMVLLMTLQERWPFLALAGLALLATTLDTGIVLVLAFVLVTIQAFGGGLTATAWQSMLGKIMPARIRGTFFGMQSSAANLMASVGALIAGSLLLLPYPTNFAIIFFAASICMAISFAFLGSTRETQHTVPDEALSRNRRLFWQRLRRIVAEDANFRWFIVARVLLQFSQMALGFYTIYAVRTFDMDGLTAGVLTGLLTLSQTVFSPLAGWAGDRWGHRTMLALGGAAMSLSAFIALIAQDISWFYLVFTLAGAVNSAHWTSMLAITVEFGNENERPYYIGISNTLTAPATLAAPFIGGLLADTLGFGMTFGVSVVGGLLGAFVVMAFLRDPVRKTRKRTIIKQAA